jgi:hypothetical protein
MYLATELEESFVLQHAMGANCAPLLARAMFVQRRFKTKCIEVFPKLSIWRIGRSLQVMKSHLLFHRHSVGGDESRRAILSALSSHNIAFVYDQDVKLMIENRSTSETFCQSPPVTRTENLWHTQQTSPLPQSLHSGACWNKLQIPAPF